VWAWAISVNGGPRDRSAHGRSGQGLGAKDRLSSRKEALPLRVDWSRWENALKGGIRCEKGDRSSRAYRVKHFRNRACRWRRQGPPVNNKDSL
jgi:hypothetical protein